VGSLKKTPVTLYLERIGKVSAYVVGTAKVYLLEARVTKDRELNRKMTTLFVRGSARTPQAMVERSPVQQKKGKYLPSQIPIELSKGTGGGLDL